MEETENSIEAEGPTVAEAVEAALQKAGLRREEVEVAVLQQPSAGFMGIGKKPARVMISQKHWGERSKPQPPAPQARQEPRRSPAGREKNARPSRPPRSSGAKNGNGAQAPAAGAEAPSPARAPSAPARPSPQASSIERAAAKPFDVSKAPAACEQAKAAVAELMALMHFKEAEIEASWEERQERVRVSITHPDVGRLIGKDGRTLEAIQMAASAALSRKLGCEAPLSVDAGGYLARREEEFIQHIEEAVAEAARTGKPYRLEPSDAGMRRFIHKHLSGRSDVETASEGEGQWRKVVIRPKAR